MRMLNASFRLAASGEYRYGLVNRPPAVGAVPNGYIAHEKTTSIPGVRHGVLVYPKPLSPNEVRQYELVELTDKFGNSLVLPYVPANVRKPAEEGAATLRYLADEGIDLDEVADEVEEAKAAIDRFKMWCKLNGHAPDKAVAELDLPKSIILSYRIAPDTVVGKLPAASKVLPLVETWVHGADKDLGVLVKVAYHSFMREHLYTIFSPKLDTVLGQISFEFNGPAGSKELIPHATLMPQIRGKGVTAFIYRLVLDKGYTLVTEEHTAMARRVWDSLAKAGYKMQMRGDCLTLRKKGIK